MSIDWKLWLVIGGLSLGLVAQLVDLTVCHWLPSAGSRSLCGTIVTDASAFGKAAQGFAAQLGGVDGGSP